MIDEDRGGRHSAFPEEGVVVTLAQMYGELQRLVGELRDVNSALRDFAAVKGDHEARLRSLERWRYGLPVAILTSLGSVISTIILIISKGRI